MSGVLDLHALLVIQNGWAFYSKPENRDRWLALFNEIAADTLLAWYEEMMTATPAFLTHTSPGTKHMPQIVVALASESNHMDLDPLGWVVEEGQPPETTALVNQSVRVSCFHNNPELTRALHVTVRAILLASVPRLLQAGYLNFQYDGVEDLMPQEELIALEKGIFIRKQLWKALAQVDVASFDPEPELKEWWVLWNKLNTIQSTGAYQTAPVDPDNPLPPNRVSPPTGVAGTPGGVVEYEPE